MCNCKEKEACSECPSITIAETKYLTERDVKNAQPTRTPLYDLVDEIDELYPIEEERQITIRKKALRKILERYFR